MRSLLLLVACVVVVACGDAKPCSDCPAVDGTYTLTFKRTTGYEGCAGATPRPATWTVSQIGSILHATLGDGGLQLQGQLLDTWDLTLTGGTDDRHVVHARAVVNGPAVTVDAGRLADGGVADAGVAHAAVHLVGTWTTASVDAGCDARDDLTGDRLP
jgi:hypothetical protein